MTHPALRADIERQLPNDLQFVFEDCFPALTGLGVAKVNARHLRCIDAVAPLLREILQEGERIHLVTHARVDYSVEAMFVGWMALLLNQTVLVATDRRILLIHTTSKFQPHLYVNEIPVSSIRKISSSFLGSLSLRLGKGRFAIGLLTRRDRKTLSRLYAGDKRATEGVRYLCPSCFQGHEKHAPACAKCGVQFRSPSKAALRSLMLPGLGDWYLGHRYAAMLEMLGSLLGWGIVLALVAVAYTEKEPGMLAVAALLLGFMNGLDALLTRWQARKGLLSSDGFLPTRTTGSAAAAARGGPVDRVEARLSPVEKHPAERANPLANGLFAIAALTILAGIAAATQGIVSAEYHGEWGAYGTELEATLLRDLERDDQLQASAQQRSAAAKCAAKRCIQFLNKSSCQYTYDPERTSEAEHLARQDQCLEQLAYADVVAEAVSECLAGAGVHVPVPEAAQAPATE